MPTTVVSKIGATNTPTTMDYSTIQSWEDACPADLTTGGVDQIWRGECYNQGTLGTFDINGETTDATHYLDLTTGAGQSFRDQSAVRTTALFINTSLGANLSASLNYSSPYVARVPYTRISNLQIVQGGVAAALAITTGPVTVDSCILQAAGTPGGNENGQGTWINCLVIQGTTFGSFFGLHIGQVYNCTLVIPAGSSSTLAGLQGSNYFASRVWFNCAVFGYAALTGGFGTSSSDFGATDATTGLEGANTLSGLTYASQFVSSTNDYRAVATGSLKAGTPSSQAPVDITGLTRDTTTPYIGCWEVAGTGPTFVPPPGKVILQAVNRAGTY